MCENNFGLRGGTGMYFGRMMKDVWRYNVHLVVCLHVCLFACALGLNEGTSEWALFY